MKRKPGIFNKVSKPLKGLLYTIILSGMILMMGSCISLDKAIKVTTKNETNAKVTNQAIKDKWEQVVAANCATWYPIKESTETDTETITGNSEELKQELRETQALADSLKQALLSIPVKPECKPEVIARDNVIRQLQNRIQTLNKLADNLKADIQKVTTTKTQESTARQRELQLEIGKQKGLLLLEKRAHLKTLEDKDELKRSRNFYRTWIWVMIGACAVWLGIKFLKPF